MIAEKIKLPRRFSREPFEPSLGTFESELDSPDKRAVEVGFVGWVSGGDSRYAHFWMEALNHVFMKSQFSMNPWMSPRLAENTSNLNEMLESYEKALNGGGPSHDPVALIGYREGADVLARHYNEFYQICPPRALVLLSPTATALDLNRMTCPYLILQGEQDPVLNSISDHQFEGAVLHHQYRYGDLTTRYVFPGLNERLGSPQPADDVVLQIVEWLRPALREGNRPQEPVGKASIPRTRSA